MIATGDRRRVRVWDLPTRVYHWTQLALVVASLYTGFVAPESWMGVHVAAGYGLVALIVFRLVWGIYGFEYSRIASFAYPPRRVIESLRGLFLLRPPHAIGHNPLGAMMVFALMAVLIALTATGLMVLGGEERQGVLRGVISFDIGAAAKEVHEGLVWTLMAMVALHVTGVVVESVLGGDNLAWAMITGDRHLPAGLPVPEPRRARPRAAALATLGICAVLGVTAAGLSQVPVPGERPLVMDPAYARECAACHGLFHPSLLPAGSWRQVMATLDDHFGEDASLAPDVADGIATFLTANAAETWHTEAANRFRRVAATDPRRITATPYWIAKHGEIDKSVYARRSITSGANCIACHRDALTPWFADQAIVIPTE
ncbi:MAG: cytochrome b/b6 domain-containing protein [Alphaproteobacteria bacterium]